MNTGLSIEKTFIGFRQGEVSGMRRNHDLLYYLAVTVEKETGITSGSENQKHT